MNMPLVIIFLRSHIQFVCGIGVVQDYDRLKKFNCLSVADEARKRLEGGEDTGGSAAPLGDPLDDKAGPEDPVLVKD